ncbi:hypothetical protein CFE70_006684 [Pyrenophora teres f. teres 0-1]|nr:hypothetical protein HRS9122_09850 [Pyrenophora teres f. teres]KAE8828302.1 hypothetical protein HRS9139_07521 [Pyrenophora teres f. teres]KAE8830902.1 hypothetical protein PTNB85_07489 [Pyrenophora teres f. teres]KAE8857100.1 hypothetical protein PTNB29_08167 [Pyrenophora teres f. teres]KAE8863553.1 hypothetical protein PTNB73_06760 [Pyrenophora teres f. teres]
MDKSRYAASPPTSGSMRGGEGAAPPSAPSSWGLQDARGNLAVQPVASTGTIKLKKAAVKMVGAAPVQTRPAAAKSVAVLSPTSGAKSPDGPVPTSSTTTSRSLITPAPTTSAPGPKIAPVKKDEGVSSHASQATLEGLFARLNSMGPTTPSRKSEGDAPVTPDKNIFAFENRLGTASTKSRATEKTATSISAEKASPVESLAEKLFLSEETKKRTHVFVDAERSKKAKSDKPKVDQATIVRDTTLAQASKPVEERVGKSQEEFEAEYMRKASEYIDTLPVEQKSASHLIQVISKKLRSLYAKDKNDQSKDSVKARFAFALFNYIKVIKKIPEPCSVDSAKFLLEDADGDFIQLCAKLVEGKYISLQTLDDVSGIVTALLNTLPEADSSITTATAVRKVEVIDSVGVEPVSKDSVENIKGWPAPEKRENLAAQRTCILKGVSGVTSINQLQALVWGGRLESISMSETGPSTAVVKFLSPTDCDKYHKETANGIKVIGDMKTVVIEVEKTDGPNSINDVIRNCIEKGTTRCVRATGAIEKDDKTLMKLARGNSQVNKREVDRIRRGKNARGHAYIEFRFANIYHALQFKRELHEREEWEHCNIQYAADPCEVAKGVHYKDEDEDE